MIRTFIDFDGTISRRDVGDLMFETFGGPRCTGIVNEYRNGALSAPECFRQECAACGDVDKARLDEFLDTQEIDPTFAEFTAWCRKNGVGCTILSDGMDYYLERILKNNGLHDVPFYANRLDLVPAGSNSHVRFVPSFPYRDEACERCACCKRNHILSLSGENDLIVYVGEGFSDRCPAGYADVVFAKDELRAYCKETGIPFVPYERFSDVTRRLGKMMDGTTDVGGVRLRKRRKAELARCDAYLGG
jgi:2,3-diketo-5-methylthio-1-phosphopentane phosphatase